MDGLELLKPFYSIRGDIVPRLRPIAVNATATMLNGAMILFRSGFGVF